MTDERMAELRDYAATVRRKLSGQVAGCLRECLDEIVRLKRERTECDESISLAASTCATQAEHIRRLREALSKVCGCPSCLDLLAETEPDRGYQPRNPTPLDPMTMKPPAGGSAVVEPRP